MKVKCAICGTEFNAKYPCDTCPQCDWGYLGYENELSPDEKTDFNHISINAAKENFTKGLTAFGEPRKE